MNLTKHSIFKLSLLLLTALIIIGAENNSSITDIKLTVIEVVFILLIFNLTRGEVYPYKKALSLIPVTDKSIVVAIFLGIFISFYSNNHILNPTDQTQMAYFSMFTSIVKMTLGYMILICLIKFKIEFSNIFMFIPASISAISISILFIGWFEIPKPLSEMTIGNAIPFNSNRNFLGHICTFSSVLCFYYFMNVKSSYNKNLLFLTVVISNLTLLIWLGGRASLISFISVCIIYSFLLVYKKKISTMRSIYFVSLFIISLLLSYYLSVFEWNGPQRYFKKYLELQTTDLFTSSSRIAIWTQTVIAIFDRPWLGYGPEGYLYHPSRVYGRHPHNVLLQFLMTYGLVTTILISYLYIKYMYIGILQVLSGIETSTPVILIILALSILSLVSGTLYFSQPTYFIVISFAIIIYNININSNK